MVLCLCGCRKNTSSEDEYWCKGHKIYPIPSLCLCGCNKIVWNGTQYKKGHNSRTRDFNGVNNSFYGKKHTQETKDKYFQNRTKEFLSKETLNKLRNHYHPINLVHGKRSHYQSPLQGQICFRSTWELAYAKYLDSIHELWMYEMETFDLGNTTYTPDFFLPRREKFIEIKGYIRPEDVNRVWQKINQFKEQYPWDLEVLRLKELKELKVL